MAKTPAFHPNTEECECVCLCVWWESQLAREFSVNISSLLMTRLLAFNAEWIRPRLRHCNIYASAWGPLCVQRYTPVLMGFLSSTPSTPLITATELQMLYVECKCQNFSKMPAHKVMYVDTYLHTKYIHTYTCSLLSVCMQLKLL